MSDLNHPVSYLEIDDFDQDGNLIETEHLKTPLFVLFQAGWCSHCAVAKPEFQKLAELGLVDCATIQVDGIRPSEREYAKHVNKIYPESFVGFPSYVLF